MNKDMGQINVVTLEVLSYQHGPINFSENGFTDNDLQKTRKSDKGI